MFQVQNFPSRALDAIYHPNWIDVTFVLQPEFPNEFHSSGSQNDSFIRDHTIMPLFEPFEFKNYRESLEQGYSATLGEGVGNVLYNQTVTPPYRK